MLGKQQAMAWKLLRVWQNTCIYTAFYRTSVCIPLHFFSKCAILMNVCEREGNRPA